MGPTNPGMATKLMEQFGFGKRAHQGQPAYRHHHGSATALQYAAGDQQMNIARYAAEK
jgi:hypothetical protein